MKKGNKRAFTLVELIVVITILAILATIGFVSFSGYLAWTRDTNRVAQLKSMSDALELYRTKKDLPIPDDKVDVQYSWSTIAYQWYIGKNVLETIEYTESGLDPKDKNYFSYYLTKNKKYFQLLTFLEEPNTDVVALNNFNKTFATDYSDRYPKTTGKKLWILTDINNIPIQELDIISWSWYLDIYDVWDVEYRSILKWDDVLSWTWTTFQSVKTFAKKWGKFCSTTNKTCTDPNDLTIPTNWLISYYPLKNNADDIFGDNDWTIDWDVSFDWECVSFISDNDNIKNNSSTWAKTYSFWINTKLINDWNLVKIFDRESTSNQAVNIWWNVTSNADDETLILLYDGSDWGIYIKDIIDNDLMKHVIIEFNWTDYIIYINWVKRDIFEYWDWKINLLDLFDIIWNSDNEFNFNNLIIYDRVLTEEEVWIIYNKEK